MFARSFFALSCALSGALPSHTTLRLFIFPPWPRLGSPPLKVRDFLLNDLVPYFSTGTDTAEKIAIRIANGAINFAKSIPLGTQVYVAVEAVDILRKHGLNGIYSLVLRKEFIAAAELLRRVAGINEKVWPLSIHEMTAAIFYSLAEKRAERGSMPEREHLMHRTSDSVPSPREKLEDDTDEFDPLSASVANILSGGSSSAAASRRSKVTFEAVPERPPPLEAPPLCSPLSAEHLSSMLFYAPIALNFIYAEEPLEMQLLCAQQGWSLLYAHLEQKTLQVDQVNSKKKKTCFKYNPL